MYTVYTYKCMVLANTTYSSLVQIRAVQAVEGEQKAHAQFASHVCTEAYHIKLLQACARATWARPS